MTLAESISKTLKRHKAFHLSEKQGVLVPHDLMLDWLNMADQLELAVEIKQRPTLKERMDSVVRMPEK